MLNGVELEEITDTGLKIRTKEGTQETIAADNILFALPLTANPALYTSLKDKGVEVYAIGDGAEPRRIIHAIHDGSRVGRMM
jgi:thioredoxin reductase